MLEIYKGSESLMLGLFVRVENQWVCLDREYQLSGYFIDVLGG